MPLDLPEYIFEQLFMQGGRRLPKQRDWRDGEPTPQYGPYSAPFDRRLPMHYNAPPPPNDFKYHEYQFWRAYRNTGNWHPLYQCRACYTSIGSGEFRRTHHEKMGCAGRISAALKIMRAEKWCADCGVVTNKTKWGVPLCGKKCIDSWMLMGGIIARLDEALRKVEANAQAKP